MPSTNTEKLSLYFPDKEKGGEGKEVLERFINSYQKLTSLRVCIYDLSYFTEDAGKLHLSIGLRRHSSSLCKYIKSSKTAHRECIRQECNNLKKAFDKKKDLLVTCHSGLSDYLFPLILNRRPIGGVLIGQVYTSLGYEKKLLQLAQKHNLNYEHLLELAQSIPLISEKRLKQNALGFGNLIVEYILTIEDNIWLKERLHPASKKIKVDEKMLYSGKSFEVPVSFLERIMDFKEVDPSLKGMLDIVCQRYRERLSHNEIAKELKISPSTLSRKCKKEIGMSFREYVLRTKLNAANHLLKNSNFTTSQIAYYLGYSDASSFLHAYKSHFGITPTEYIRRSI